MILQRLAEHYDRIAASGNEDSQLAPPGFSRQKISFCVVLEPDGRLNQFKSMQEKVGRALVATSMIVPGQTKPTGQGLNPCFLWDNVSYMLGWNSDPKKASRAIRSFDAFRKKHLESRLSEIVRKQLQNVFFVVNKKDCFFSSGILTAFGFVVSNTPG